MSGDGLDRRSKKEHLNQIADEIMAYLKNNEKDFTPRQLILSHGVKNKLVKLLEQDNMREAEKLQFEIETDLVVLWLVSPVK